MRTLPEIAEAVVKCCQEAGLERVKVPSWIGESKEGDHRTIVGSIPHTADGVCRVCVLGSAWFSQARGAISEDDAIQIISAIESEFELRRDFSSDLATVPDTESMWQFLRDAATHAAPEAKP